MKKNILSCIAIITILISANAHAIDAGNDLESLLNDASDIATKKSVNVDYLPSIVTVINAQTFVDNGVQNVGEALGMLPGIQVQVNYIGRPVTNVRGFKNPNSFISDKIKILIDGVAINNEAAGTSGFYMDFPIKLVEKIEVLRGPGSTVYGAGAFYGAVNIITKLGSSKSENQLYLGAGSYQNKTMGANINTSAGKWEIFTDGYYETNDKSIDDNGQATDEAMRNISLGFKVINGNFKFLTRYKSSHYGNFYIYKGEVEPNQDKGHKSSYFFSQLSYTTNIDDFKLVTKLSFSNRESDTSGYFDASAKHIASLFAKVDVDLQDAYYVREEQVEQNFKALAILTLPKIMSNDISVEIGARKTRMIKNKLFSSIENAIANNIDAILAHPNYADFRFNEQSEPAYWQHPLNTDVFAKTNRTITHANLQDLIALNTDTDLVLGARVDHYSDIGAEYSSRVALIYRASDELIFKLLYGSAFRAPTFTESYSLGHIDYRAGDKDIKPERTNTYEAAIIYKPDFNNKFSLNVFYSELSNVIDLEEFEGTPAGYQNMKDRTGQGVEFEYFFRTKTVHDLYVNASYIDMGYTVPGDSDSPVEIDQSTPDLSKIMLKAMYTYHPTSQLSFGTVWQHYSETTQTQLYWVIGNPDKDSTVDEQDIFDETVTYKFSDSSILRLTIKNIFNEEVRNPSYYYRLNGGVLREGRNFFLNYTYLF